MSDPSSPSTYLSPRDLGAAIGVSESSIKRWADQGDLEMVRTSGGHRRIRLAEAVRFIRAHGHAILRPELLELPNRARNFSALPAGDHAHQLEQFLVDGHYAAARGALVHAFAAGVDLVTLARDVLQPALARIGERWHHGPDGIAVEHAATEACLVALHEIGRLLPAAKGPLAIGGAPEWDPYQLPTLLAAMALESAGWRTVNLGPRAPLDAQLCAVDRLAPKLVWQSISSVSHAAEAADHVKTLVRRVASRHVRVVVGGRACAPLAPLEKAFPAERLLVTDSLAKLQDVARSLRSARR